MAGTCARPAGSRSNGAAQAAFGAALDRLDAASGEAALLTELLIERAGLLVDRGRIAEAEKAYARIDPRDRRAVAQFFHGLGRLRLEKGDFRGAEDALAQAVAIRSQALSPNDPDTIRSLTQLAYALKCLGRRRDAARLYEQAYDACLSVLGENYPDLVTILDSLGGLYADEGDHPKARAAYERGIGLAERSLGPDHPDLGQSWNNLGLVHLREGATQSARSAHSRPRFGCWSLRSGPRIRTSPRHGTTSRAR